MNVFYRRLELHPTDSLCPKASGLQDPRAGLVLPDSLEFTCHIKEVSRESQAQPPKTGAFPTRRRNMLAEGSPQATLRFARQMRHYLVPSFTIMYGMDEEDTPASFRALVRR